MLSTLSTSLGDWKDKNISGLKSRVAFCPINFVKLEGLNVPFIVDVQFIIMVKVFISQVHSGLS